MEPPRIWAESVAAEGRQGRFQVLRYHSALWVEMNAVGGSTEVPASLLVAVAVEGCWTRTVSVDAADMPQDHSEPVEEVYVLQERLTAELEPEFEGRRHSARLRPVGSDRKSVV